MKTFHPEFPSPYRLYILMRTDLPSMNPGRAMAQAAHAANQFVYEHGKDKNVKKWQRDANGFGTTICLAATKSSIDNLFKIDTQHLSGLVYDPTYKFEVSAELSSYINIAALTAPTIKKEDGSSIMFRDELTCAYIFISEDDPDREKLVGHFSLHP